MRLIYAHRGNLNGPSKWENDPYYIKEAIDAKFLVEVDIRLENGQFFTGHDEPQYKIAEKDLDGRCLYHCKNIPAYLRLQELAYTGYYVDYFIHSDEPIVRTDAGMHWVHPDWIHFVSNDARDLQRFVAVMPEKKVILGDVIPFGGICTDYPVYYKDM